MEEKIQKWEEEIEKITQRQKEMNAKYTEQIRELRKKIEGAKQQLLIQNNLWRGDRGKHRELQGNHAVIVGTENWKYTSGRSEAGAADSR